MRKQWTISRSLKILNLMELPLFVKEVTQQFVISKCIQKNKHMGFKVMQQSSGKPGTLTDEMAVFLEVTLTLTISKTTFLRVNECFYNCINLEDFILPVSSNNPDNEVGRQSNSYQGKTALGGEMGIAFPNGPLYVKKGHDVG